MYHVRYTERHDAGHEIISNAVAEPLVEHLSEILTPPRDSIERPVRDGDDNLRKCWFDLSATLMHRPASQLCLSEQHGSSRLQAYLMAALSTSPHPCIPVQG